MKVSEMIEWLKTQPQDAEVSCVYHSSGSGYYEQGGTVEIIEFNAAVATHENNWFSDFEFYQYQDGRAILTIGSTGN